LCARDLTADEAWQIACEFYAARLQESADAASRPLQGGGACPVLRRAGGLPARETSGTAFYAFNADEGRGFVLVSGDDRMRPVLGYSLEGAFSFDDVPVQLRPLLDAYRRHYEAIKAGGDALPAKVTAYATAARRLPAGAVAPLLGGICWDQEAPFNRLCPTDKYVSRTTPAGCVAIAAAQIMRYYAYPAQGRGSRSYVTETERLSVNADFASASYAWDKMLPSYNGAYTEEQADAVALLAYHVGVACKTDYNYEGSGATAKEIAKAFTTYFGYDENIEYVDRTHYDAPSWEALLRVELEAGRPVLEFGEGEAGGHAFVCDGYDAEGLFHYNWGWGGMSNGYYSTSALEPEYLGTGSGLGAYNFLQAVLTHVQPPTPGSGHVAGLHLSKPLVPGAAATGRTDETKVTAAFYNYGLRNFTGEVALVLCGEDETPLRVLSSKSLTNLRELSGGTPGTDFVYALPADVPDGHYRLYLMHKEKGAADYTVMRAPVTQSNCLTAQVTADRVTYAVPALAAKLVLTAKPEVLTPLYHKRRASFRITVRNDGEEFYSYLGILLQKQNTGIQKVRQYVGVILTRVPAGATRTFTYTADSLQVGTGAFDVVAVCDPYNAQDSYLDAIGPDELMVTEANISNTPILSPRFALAGPLTIAATDGSETLEPGEMFTVTAPMLNSGGYGDGDFALVFFNRAEENIGNSNVVPLSLGMRQQRDLEISHRLNVPPGQYGVVLAQVRGNEASAVAPASYNGRVFDLVAPTGLVTVATPAEKVDVYTVDGVRLRRGVGRDEALRGLPHGVYVVGGKKVCR